MNTNTTHDMDLNRTKRNRGRLLRILLVVLLVFTAVEHTNAQDLTAAKVRRSVQRATKFLLNSQNQSGGWTDTSDNRFPEGITSLATLALLNAGVSPENPKIKNAIERIIDLPESRLSTYVASLKIMVLATADPKGQLYRRELKSTVDWLIDKQLRRGPIAGGWSYPAGMATADSSNSQYALLALHEANKVGIPIPKNVWKLALSYWKNCFNRSTGGFGYNVTKQRINGAMTCAGISSTIIAMENLIDANDFIKNGSVQCCIPNQEEQMLEKAIAWMGKAFSVKANPSLNSRRDQKGQFYYLYGMERAGRLAGRRFFGPHDWYREGAEFLVNTQKLNGSWVGSGTFNERNPNVATSFALLFLSKGKRPIVVGKYKFGVGNEWDIHPKGIHYLTRELEQQWKAGLNWQTIDGNAATLFDLAETPVLFLSGREQLTLTSMQKKAMKEYVENGNFLFAEASQGNGCGENVAFDRKFRSLMAELFPETNLKPISASHPIWNSHFQIQPNPEFPVLGLEACCRTSVIYVPRSLTGHWQLNAPNLVDNLPRQAGSDVRYCTELGVNVVSYATGRQLRDKLDLPDVSSGTVSVLNNRALILPKLNHQGGADDAPNAWRNVLRRANEIGLTIDLEKKFVSVEPEQLFDHPFVFMHGRNEFYFKNAEVEALTNYLKGGNRGFIFADAICSSESFQDAFERQIVRLVPDSELKVIRPDHPIWTDEFGGFNIKSVTITRPDKSRPDGFARLKTPPELKGIEINGRLVVVYSPLDLSCALENATISHCEGYTRQDAIKLAINVLLYRLQGN